MLPAFPPVQFFKALYVLPPPIVKTAYIIPEQIAIHSGHHEEAYTLSIV